MANWIEILKPHLQINRKKLVSTQQDKLQLIGTKSTPNDFCSNKFNIYDHLLSVDIIKNMEEVLPYGTDFLLFLNKYDGKVRANDLINLLQRVRNGVLINLHQNDWFNWSNKMQNFKNLKELSSGTYEQFDKFDITDVIENIILAKRRYYKVHPIYMYEVMEKKEEHFVLYQPLSRIIYPIPEGTKYININSLKHPWSGELEVYLDDELYTIEGLESKETVENFTIQINVLFEKRKLKLKVNCSDKRPGNEAWIKDVQFS